MAWLAVIARLLDGSPLCTLKGVMFPAQPTETVGSGSVLAWGTRWRSASTCRSALCTPGFFFSACEPMDSAWPLLISASTFPEGCCATALAIENQPKTRRTTTLLIMGHSLFRRPSFHSSVSLQERRPLILTRSRIVKPTFTASAPRFSPCHRAGRLGLPPLWLADRTAEPIYGNARPLGRRGSWNPCLGALDVQHRSWLDLRALSSRLLVFALGGGSTQQSSCVLQALSQSSAELSAPSW